MQVDGGVSTDTAKQCLEAGADVLVAGTAIFSKTDRAKAIEALKGE